MEKVNFKIDLKIITHDEVKEHPFVNISINGFPQFGEICDKDTLVDIDVEVQDDTDNFLSIEYMNKDPITDVVFNNTEIIKDKRVEISSIFVNDVQLNIFALDDPDLLSYVPIDTSGKSSIGFPATKLSWNGRTTLKFSTPIYIWLLENL